jgi:hypothetical protein
MESDRPPFATPTALEPLLARAADAGVMLRVFERVLPTLTRTPIRVTACHPHVGQVRSRLMMAYDVAIELPRDEQQELHRRLLGTLPVTPEFLTPELLDCCRAARGHPEVFPFEQLATFVPELQLGLQFFPVDAHLPALIPAMRGDGGLVAPFLEEVRRGARIDAVRPELVRYKPGRRAVVRFTAQLSGAGRVPLTRVVYGKILRDSRGAGIYEEMKALWQIAQRSGCLRVPEPLGYDAERQMLVMAEAPGERNLAVWIKCLKQHTPLPPTVDLDRLERCMVVVAQALAELHHSGIHPPRESTFRSELAGAMREVELVRAQYPVLAGEIDRLLQDLEALPPVQEARAATHHAFRYRQLVGGDARLTILDWDGLRFAHPARDGASFVCSLRDVRKAQSPRTGALDHLADVFCREFLLRHPEVRPYELAVYQALVLTETALRVLRGPKRVDRVVQEVHSLLAEAEQLLHGMPFPL